jgi:hypothetical protein
MRMSQRSENADGCQLPGMHYSYEFAFLAHPITAVTGPGWVGVQGEEGAKSVFHCPDLNSDRAFRQA